MRQILSLETISNNILTPVPLFMFFWSKTRIVEQVISSIFIIICVTLAILKRFYPTQQDLKTITNIDIEHQFIKVNVFTQI